MPRSSVAALSGVTAAVSWRNLKLAPEWWWIAGLKQKKFLQCEIVKVTNGAARGRIPCRGIMRLVPVT